MKDEWAPKTALGSSATQGTLETKALKKMFLDQMDQKVNVLDPIFPQSLTTRIPYWVLW